MFSSGKAMRTTFPDSCLFVPFIRDQFCSTTAVSNFNVSNFSKLWSLPSTLSLATANLTSYIIEETQASFSQYKTYKPTFPSSCCCSREPILILFNVNLSSPDLDSIPSLFLRNINYLFLFLYIWTLNLSLLIRPFLSSFKYTEIIPNFLKSQSHIALQLSSYYFSSSLYEHIFWMCDLYVLCSCYGLNTVFPWK